MSELDPGYNGNHNGTTQAAPDSVGPGNYLNPGINEAPQSALGLAPQSTENRHLLDLDSHMLQA